MPVQLLQGNLTYLKRISQSDEENENEVISKELQTMIDLYKDSDRIYQSIILSVLDKPKEEIMQLFGCTKYKINQAHLLKTNLIL